MPRNNRDHPEEVRVRCQHQPASRNKNTHVQAQPRDKNTLPLAASALAPELARGCHMSEVEILAAKLLHKLGIPQAAIARAMERNPMAISRAVRRETAREILVRNQVRLARSWVRSARIAARRGRHEPAQAALEAIGAVDRPGAGTGRGVTVNVGVALPGLPGGDRTEG